MTDDIFKQHGIVVNSLLRESIVCTPESWAKGIIFIEKDGESISCKISNEKGESINNPSNMFSDLCEKLYYYMANIGNDWSKATITYRNDVSLDVEMSFEYEKGSQSSHFEIKDLPDSDSELSDIVKLFIKDYEDWNAFAYERRNISKNTREDISYQSYKQLIQKYCHKDKKFQGLSYGGESSHSQYNEKINCVIQSDDYGIVNTSNAKGDEYEYHFFINGGRWVLDEVYYIDFCSGRKYESL